MNQLPWTKGRGNMIGQACVTYTHQEGGVGSSFQRRREYFFQEGEKGSQADENNRWLSSGR